MRGLVVKVGLLACCLLALGAAAAVADSPPWLAEINLYRAAASLPPVSENPAWDLGIEHHLVYLAKTPAGYRTGQYASAHTENPSSPYFTGDGATEAGSSDLALGGASTPVSAIDIWLAAPFHAIGMLRPQLTQVALAVDATTGYAGLDVIQGIDRSRPPASTPVLFPGPGVTTSLVRFGGESPDPRETCGWQNLDPVGLPLIALLPSASAPGASATLTGPGAGESTSAGDLCLVDTNTFHSSDSVYGPAGASILRGDNAVLLIPRRPLVSGTYTAQLTEPGQAAIGWSFSVKAPKPPPCPLCVSATTPAAFSVPATVRPGHAFTVSFAGWKRFSVTITIWSARDRKLKQVSFDRLKPAPAQWTFKMALSRRASRHGSRVLVSSRFTIGSRHVTLRRRITFR